VRRPPVIGRGVVLELALRLIAEVVAVDQEQNTLEPAVLEKPVRLCDGSERLAGSGGHLDKRTSEALLSKRPLDASDGLDLRRPQSLDEQLRHGADLAPPGGRAGIGLGVTKSAGESPRLGEREDPACPGFGVIPVGEVSLGSGRFENERQLAVDR
jgi:hypothetical protein